MPTPVFQSDCVSVVFDAELNTIHYAWKRFAKGAEFREALEQGLKGAQRLKATGWIGDVQYLGVVDEADTQWVNGDWFPRLLSGTGITHMAVIVGERAITRMSVGSIMSKVAGKLTNKYVATTEEGRAWIATEQRLKKSA